MSLLLIQDTLYIHTHCEGRSILQNMKRASLDGVELEYAVEGSGEPAVLIHGSIVADSLATLRAEPTLKQGYQVISYCRRGFGGSTHPKGPLSIREQAADCRKLMDHLNINKAHVVGHSYGGGIAMQLAADSSEYVHSLSLLFHFFLCERRLHGLQENDTC